MNTTDHANTTSGAAVAAPVDQPVRPGAWISMEFGFSRRVFYVVRVDSRGAWICSTKWLVSDAEHVTNEKIRRADVIGYGRARWWWRMLPWRNLVAPYSKPSSLYWA